MTATLAQRITDRAAGWLAARTSRRGFLARTGVVGSALALDPVGYVLKPGTAYAAVCGPGASCSSGWTVFCATINKGVNACPPGSIAAGWWKADGASLCGGRARYIIDCNATCSKCSSPGARAGICSSSCWNCSCTCGPGTSCDQRRVCCNAFRYGQCNTQVRQVGGVVCRVVSCTPPWKFERCSTSPATDNRTRDHSSDALPAAFTPITRRYIDMGELGSVLGATVYGEVRIAGGTAQRYQSGRISWSQATGARETVGPLAQRYEALGAEAGSLGFPVRFPQRFADGGEMSVFQRGRIWHHPRVGAWEVGERLMPAYARADHHNGQLGYPVGGDREVGDGRGRYSAFERGRISWSPTTDAHWMSAPIAQRYAALGAERSVLGYPVTDTFAVREWVWTPSVMQQRTRSRFERGTITHDERTGVTTVTVDPVSPDVVPEDPLPTGSSSPSASPSASPTTSPSASPTTSPTASPEPSATASPSPSDAPSPSPSSSPGA